MARGDNNKVRAAIHEERILALLSGERMTLAGLAAKMGLSLDSMYLYRNRLVSEPKRIYIVDYDHTGARPAPVYAAGNMPDAEYVPTRKPKLEENPAEKRRRQLVELLTESEQTAEQVGLRLHLSTSRARFYINELRTATPKRAYIKRWQHPGQRGDLAPVYALGSKPDSQKPRMSRAARYKKEKADPEKYHRILVKRRTRYAVDKAISKPNTWASALGL